MIMPRGSGSPERKRSRPSSDSEDTKPNIKPKVQSNNKAYRGRIDGSARSVLASIVIQRGIASALAEIDTVTAAVSCRFRSQLTPRLVSRRSRSGTNSSLDVRICARCWRELLARSRNRGQACMGCDLSSPQLREREGLEFAECKSSCR